MTFLKIPENPEMTLTKTLCNIVQLFLELFKVNYNNVVIIIIIINTAVIRKP